MRRFALLSPPVVTVLLLLTKVLAFADGPAKLSQIPVAQNYGNLPLSFEANQGQTDPSVQFLSHGQAYTLFLRQQEAILTLNKADSGSDGKTEVVHMKLKGANTRSAVSREAPQITRTNYFLGNDPSRWRTNIPNYGRIRYSAIYPGIDLVYYGNQRQLEYDFILAPGANPARIRLNFTGATRLQISPDGSLILHDPAGPITFHKPLIYQQEKNRQRNPVAGNFKLVSNNTVGFALGKYDRSQPLVIDPVLVYSTYLGGSGANGQGDQGNGIAVDSNGNAYLVGATYSTNFPLTVDAHQALNYAALAHHGSTVFVSKLNAAGTALVYSTYLGGSGDSSGGDFGYGIALDPQNNAYVTGATNSTDFPITCGAYQPTNSAATSGAATAFVTKLNPAGNGLAYSTYLGGSGNHATPANGDVAQAIAVNSAGNAYVTGYTWSPDFPVSDTAFQTSFAGTPTTSNAFVSELSPSGTALTYSTYLGGNGANGVGDYSNAIAIDTAGDAFVTGSTGSSNFPVTPGAYQTATNSSQVVFVTKLNSQGTGELFSTYIASSLSYGGSAQAIAVDGKGFAYIAGTTQSDFPVTPGTLEDSVDAMHPYLYLQDGYASFVTKLSQDGSALEYSTYLEGIGMTVTGLAVDSTGHAYVTGSAPSGSAGANGGFQQTPDALAAPSSTGNAAFLVKLDPAATVLNYATLLGGGANDGADALALDPAGNVYLTGFTTSADFPTTTGAFQTTNHAQAPGGSNVFVSKLALASEANQTAYDNLPASIGTSMTVTGEIVANCGPEPPSINIIANVTLKTDAAGPPPTGTLLLTDTLTNPNSPPNYVPVTGPWAKGGDYGTFTLNNLYAYFTAPSPFTDNWTVSFAPNAVYGGSSLSGSFTTPGCSSSSIPAQSFEWKTTPSLKSRDERALESTLVSALPAPASRRFQGPKFIPTAGKTPREPGLRSSLPPSVTRENSSACTAPLTPLTVTLYNNLRSYGAANPSFYYKVSGLLNGDTVTVSPQTTAIPSSPVGTYPVTTAVGGPAAANYAVTVIDASLFVDKATLRVWPSPATRGVLYGGSIPAMTGFSLTGFVNGDTSAAVSGAPVLSTAATSSSPVGYYPIILAPGTLAAANYKFQMMGGRFYIYHAVLTATPASFTIHVGDPLPTLTYSLSGFLNGDTPAVVTGTPVLTTTAKSSANPGTFKITGKNGTLQSQNYDFYWTSGTLTILP